MRFNQMKLLSIDHETEFKSRKNVNIYMIKF